LVESHRVDAGPVRAAWQVARGAALDEVEEPLPWRDESAARRDERRVLERPLKGDPGERVLGPAGASSSGVTSTTMPAFVKASPRLDGDHPLRTTSSAPVAARQITPPGRMQKEKTPRPSTCWTSAVARSARGAFVRDARRSMVRGPRWDRKEVRR
jgi:hypothetical protein